MICIKIHLAIILSLVIATQAKFVLNTGHEREVWISKQSKVEYKGTIDIDYLPLPEGCVSADECSGRHAYVKCLKGPCFVWDANVDEGPSFIIVGREQVAFLLAVILGLCMCLF